MSTFTMMDKSDTLTLREDAEPIERFDMHKVNLEHPMLYSQLQAWYKTHKIIAGSHELKKKKITEILGEKPHFNPVGEFKNALWGLKWHENPVLLYSSQKGTSIEVMPKFPKEDVAKLLMDLRDLLMLAGYRDKVFFQDKYF